MKKTVTKVSSLLEGPATKTTPGWTTNDFRDQEDKSAKTSRPSNSSNQQDSNRGYFFIKTYLNRRKNRKDMICKEKRLSRNRSVPLGNKQMKKKTQAGFIGNGKSKQLKNLFSKHLRYDFLLKFDFYRNSKKISSKSEINKKINHVENNSGLKEIKKSKSFLTLKNSKSKEITSIITNNVPVKKSKSFLTLKNSKSKEITSIIANKVPVKKQKIIFFLDYRKTPKPEQTSKRQNQINFINFYCKR